MDEGNYDKILERLCKSSGVEAEEINRRVEAKRAKLSGLISREGALQVIAAELGISFDEEKLKIDELLSGMRKVNFSGKIVKAYPIRTFTNKDGGEGKVANIFVADETGNIKVVLWDTNHIALLESGDVEEGSSIEIGSGSMRQGEVHMGSFSDFKKSDELFENVKTEKVVKEKEIKEFNVGERINSRAFVVQSFQPRFFIANIDTGRKATEDEISKGIPTEKRVILNVIIDDGTETIRAVMFHEMVQKLGLNEFENEELMAEQVQNILGSEKIFSGDVRMNSYFNTPELIVNGIDDLDLDQLVSSLE
jgi:hypothetical protein